MYTESPLSSRLRPLWSKKGIVGVFLTLYVVNDIFHTFLDFLRDAAYTAKHAGAVMNFLGASLDFLTTAGGNLVALVVGVALIMWTLRPQQLESRATITAQGDRGTAPRRTATTEVTDAEAGEPPQAADVDIEVVDWRFTYMVYSARRAETQPDGTTKIVGEEYKLQDPTNPRVTYARQDHIPCAVYMLTAIFYNGMDEAVTLRSVSMSFAKNGVILFEDRPFSEKASNNAGGITPEDMQRRHRILDVDAAFKPWDHMKPVGPIFLPARRTKRVRLTGYVRFPYLNYALGGCDEVRLQATLDDGELFIRPIAETNTAPRQQ